MSREQELRQVREFAGESHYEEGHSEQVARLSGLLFDGLKALRGYGEDERYFLVCAGILHDIGWAEGQVGHHKAARRMIMDDVTMPFSERDRAMVAMVARYHRKGLPKEDHAVYRDLSEEDQDCVRFLGGIIRVADGLDRSHMSVVEGVEVVIGEEWIDICLKTGRHPAGPEMMVGKKKADLLEIETGREVRILK